MRRTHHFNMTEVVLALGVIAIGVLSIMALFPIGLQAGHDAVSESYAADSADQFLHWYAHQLKTNWTAFNTTAQLPDDKPDDSEPVPPATPSGPDDDGWPRTGPEVETIGDTMIIRPSGFDGLVRVIVSHGTPEVTDFDGVYRVWLGDVVHRFRTTEGDGSVGSEDSFTWDRNQAVAINLEASWPKGVPYENRRKQLYRLEVFRFEQ